MGSESQLMTTEPRCLSRDSPSWFPRGSLALPNLDTTSDSSGWGKLREQSSRALLKKAQWVPRKHKHGGARERRGCFLGNISHMETVEELSLSLCVSPVALP